MKLARVFLVLVSIPGIVTAQSGTVVLGEETAKARAAEERRKKTVKSPMPAASYDFWGGEYSLINPTKNSLDVELSGLCERYAKSNARARAALRNAISMDEFYTLLNFSKRSAVFAIREQNVNWVRNGLTAVAMIEAERTDYRDIGTPLGLLYHAAKRLGANGEHLFQDAVKLSEPNVARVFKGFLGRSPTQKDLRSELFDEVETKDGVGFIGHRTEPYNPTYDLKRIALDISDLIARDKYQSSSVDVATELPSVWLDSKENRSLKSVLTKVRAAATIHGKLRPNEHPTDADQGLMIFLVEVADEGAAQELLEMSKKKRPKDYAMLGLAEQRLFCLVIGTSWAHGVTSFETPETLPRLAPGIAAILKDARGVR